MSKPSLRDRLRPLELLVISAVLGIFAGLVVLMATREVVLALVFLGIAFIVSLVVLAMLALTMAPTGDERSDLAEQDQRSVLDRGDDERNRGH
ncbi:MAG: hypothetical protein JWP19_2128 [Rhodoglobus sp.]|nr:hypothetical protein [Rhodoglobus sp.]